MKLLKPKSHVCNEKPNMFCTTVLVGKNTIIDRAIFWTLEQAAKYAKDQSREKVWTLWDDTVYCGNVEVRVYKPTLNVPSDHIDEPIAIFRD